MVKPAEKSRGGWRFDRCRNVSVCYELGGFGVAAGWTAVGVSGLAGAILPSSLTFWLIVSSHSSTDLVPGPVQEAVDHTIELAADA